MRRRRWIEITEQKQQKTRNTIVEPVDAAHGEIYAVARLTIYSSQSGLFGRLTSDRLTSRAQRKVLLISAE